MKTLKQKIIDSLESLPEEMLAEVLDFTDSQKAKLASDSLGFSSQPNGAAIAKIAERLAASGAFSEIKDPSAWQREIRQDRPLPGRS